jgi:hypothetical protein
MKRWLVVVSLLVVAQTAFADDDALYTCKVPSGKIYASFKPGVELSDLVTWYMGFTCKNVIVGAGVDVSTKVTILTPTAMTSRQAVKLFIDAVDAAGFGVAEKGDNLVIKLGPSSPRPCSGAPARMPSAIPKTADATPPAPPEPDVEETLATGIKKIDDTHVEITEKVIDAVLANPMAVGKGARVVPAVKDGKPDGFKLYAIRPSSFYARIGLANGDTLRRINGFELTSADKALEVYTKVREAKSFELDITRRGKPLTLMITIKN